MSPSRRLTLVAGSPFSGSGVGTLAGRYADLLERRGWSTRVFVPEGPTHQEGSRTPSALPYERLFAAGRRAVEQGDYVVVLGLPDDRAHAQRAVDTLTGLPRCALLWERPARPNAEVAADLSGVAGLRRVWTLNEVHARSLRGMLPRTTTVSVAPFCLPAAFLSEPSAPPDPTTPPYAVYLGRFDEWKGACLLAEVWAHRVHPATGTALVMIGLGMAPGSAGENLVLATARDHPDRVRPVRTTRIDDRVRLLRHAVVAVFPGRHEHLPQSLIEAMAVGTPTICTAIDGYAPVARDQVTSLLVDTGLRGLETAVLRLRDGPELRESISRQARDEVRRRFHPDAAAVWLEGLITALGESGAPERPDAGTADQ